MLTEGISPLKQAANMTALSVTLALVSTGANVFTVSNRERTGFKGAVHLFVYVALQHIHAAGGEKRERP